MQQLHGSEESPTGMPGHRPGYAMSCSVQQFQPSCRRYRYVLPLIGGLALILCSL